MRYDDEKRASRGSGRDYMERSERRSGYRPHNASRRRRSTFWDGMRLVLSCIACVVCFPLGLIALWTGRQGAGCKLLLTIVTGILFFMLASFALTVETPFPVVTRMQEKCISSLSVLEDRMERSAAVSQQAARQLPVLALQAAVPALEWAQETLPEVQARRADRIERLLPIVDEARFALGNALYTWGLMPEPPVPVAQPTLEPTVEPTQSPVETDSPAQTEAPEPTPDPTAMAPVVTIKGTATPTATEKATAAPEAQQSTVPPAAAEKATVAPEAQQSTATPAAPKITAVPTAEPTEAPEIDYTANVYYDKATMIFHTDKNCSAINGTLPMMKRSIAQQSKGYAPCPICVEAP